MLLKHATALSEPLLGISPQPTTKPCYLTTTGRLLPPGTLLPWDYWLRPTQEPAHQYDALKAVIDDRYFIMTTLGAYPFGYAGRTARKQTLDKVRFMEPYRVDVPELETFAAARQRLHEVGLA